jgi:K+ transporter
MDANNKIPVTFWIIAGIAVLWNLMGVFAFATDLMMSAEGLAAMEENQRAMYEAMPSWTKIPYGIATIGGLIGSIGLIMRKKWSIPALLISLICVLIQFGYTFFGTNALEIMGNGSMTMPIGIILIALFLWYYAKKSDARGLLN